MSRAKVIDRLRKLFALADPSRGGTENEVEVAMRQARKLMAEHNLEMSQIETELAEGDQGPTFIIERAQAHERKGNVSLKRYEHWLASTVDLLCGTQSMISSFKGREQRYNRCWLSFIGEATDSALASAMWNELRKTVHRWSRKRCGKGFTPSHRHYCEGFVFRLYERAKGLSSVAEDDLQDLGLTPEQAKTSAMVFVGKQQALAKAVADLKLRKRKRSAQTGAADWDAYGRGYVDGDSVDLGTERRLGDGQGDS